MPYREKPEATNRCEKCNKLLTVEDNCWRKNELVWCIGCYAEVRRERKKRS